MLAQIGSVICEHCQELWLISGEVRYRKEKLGKADFVKETIRLQRIRGIEYKVTWDGKSIIVSQQKQKFALIRVVIEGRDNGLLLTETTDKTVKLSYRGLKNIFIVPEKESEEQPKLKCHFNSS